MTYPLARIAEKWVGAPLAMHPAKAAAMAEAFAPRVLGAPVNVPRIEAGVLREELRDMTDDWGRKVFKGLPTIDGVAVVEVEGTLVDKGKWQGNYCDQTSYEALSLLVADARDDDGIKAVAFEVDSPGGLVDGAFELADEIAALSAEKPTIAILTPLAASAAYLLASACRTIVIPTLGMAGSIGTMAMYVNASKAYAEAGFDVTVFRSGEKKADGHPLVEPREGFAADMQAMIDATAEHFFATVARYRGDVLDVDTIRAMQAGVYSGQAAVDAGLADLVMAPKAAFAAFVEKFG